MHDPNTGQHADPPVPPAADAGSGVGDLPSPAAVIDGVSPPPGTSLSFADYEICEPLQERLRAYVERHVLPPEPLDRLPHTPAQRDDVFVRAVLYGDLFRAFAYSGDHDLETVCGWLVWTASALTYGGREWVERWLEAAP